MSAIYLIHLFQYIHKKPSYLLSGHNYDPTLYPLCSPPFNELDNRVICMRGSLHPP